MVHVVRRCRRLLNAGLLIGAIGVAACDSAAPASREEPSCHEVAVHLVGLQLADPVGPASALPASELAEHRAHLIAALAPRLEPLCDQRRPERLECAIRATDPMGAAECLEGRIP